MSTYCEFKNIDGKISPEERRKRKKYRRIYRKMCKEDRNSPNHIYNISNEEMVKIEKKYCIPKNVIIPYEINQHFFVQLSTFFPFLKFFSFPDYGSGFVMKHEELEDFLKEIDWVEKNMDSILKKIGFSSIEIGLHDDGYSEDYTSYGEWIEIGRKIASKEDIIKILLVLKEKITEAQNRGFDVGFIGD